MHATGFLLTMLLAVSIGANAESPQQSKVFERVFGIPRSLPPDLVAELGKLKPGERLERDRDGDGKADALWYFDTAKRHTVTPLLVLVHDEDGDLAETGRGDRDSDCYFWDHGADGFIDIVTDYQDDDGDGDVDQMGIFYDKNWKDDKDDITVWWSVDIGDDNLLWYDVNGNYYQPLCQWRTHFGGNELFYQFRLTEEDEKWVNVWEDPFAFYDPDGDGCSEMVIRISAVGHEVKNLRYSIDADNDAYGGRTRNYDFSVTALPPEEGLSTEGASTASLMLRGIETHPALPWEETPAFAQNAPWGKAMFIWDALNSNTDEDPKRDPNERWEGLLNHASKRGDFEQVGGPPCSKYNKRFEVSDAPASPLQLYWDDTDRSFHLLGASYGYLDVDFDLDGVADAAYTWEDQDGDGVLDRRQADVDGDGTTDFDAAMGNADDAYPLTFEAIAPKYTQALDKVLNESQRFIDVAAQGLGGMPADTQAIVDFYNGPLADYHPERELGEYIRKSPAGGRFYTELVRDRLYVHARKAFASKDGWKKVEAQYLAGNHEAAAAALAGCLGQSVPEDINNRPLTHNGHTYTKRIAMKIAFETEQPQPVDASPVILDIASAKKVNPDFNPANCVVVDGDFRLAWRVIPHQVDDWAMGDFAELSYLADQPAAGEKTYFIYYAPEGELENDYPVLTNAGLDQPTYVAWESDSGAYRFYTGQFDFFGKQEARLLPRPERRIYPLIGVDHHQEQDWGIDALHVNKTSGLGGLTLYLGERECPIQSPAGEGYVEFKHRVLGAGPVRAAVEIEAANVLPETPDKKVIFRCFSYARRAESEIQVRLPEGLRNPQLAVGLLRLTEGTPFADVSKGLLGTWGRQGDDIGQIGLAVIVHPSAAKEVLDLPAERRLICRPYYQQDWKRYHLQYWILGAWRRGMQYPIAPTPENWQRSAEALAGWPNAHRNTTIVAAETVAEPR